MSIQKKSLSLFLCLFSLYSCNPIKASEDYTQTAEYQRAMTLVNAAYSTQLDLVKKEQFDPNECINGDPLLYFLLDKGLTHGLTDAIVEHKKFNPNMKNSKDKRLVDLLLTKHPGVAQQVMDHDKFELTRPISVPVVKQALAILASNEETMIDIQTGQIITAGITGAFMGMGIFYAYYHLVPNEVNQLLYRIFTSNGQCFN